MPGFSVGSKNRMLDAESVTQVSAHSGDPGANGTANELSGGTYARAACTLAAAANGARAVTNNPQINVPPSATVNHIAFWGTNGFVGSKAVTAETYSSNGGVYSVSNASGLDLNG